MRRIVFLLLIVPAILLIVSRWENLAYYKHLAVGQVHMLAARRSIDKVAKDPHTKENLRQHLQLIPMLKEFAEKNLHLPAKGQFVYYVDHGRPHTVWNVYAAPKFSVLPKTWCFPIVGCTAYKGFFSLDRAENLAAKLERQGYDVHISHAAGYSTLGWFSDPIYKNLLTRGEAFVAGYIFHELAHKKIYVKGDTHFNEGFAVAVEQEGVRRWLESRDRQDLFAQYIQRTKRRQEFAALVHNTQAGLSELYADKNLNPSVKTKRKQYLFEQMKKDFLNIKTGWNNYSGYDSWFATPLNNARLIPTNAYYDLVPAFTGMIQSAGGDMKIFYARVKAIAQKPKHERDLILKSYAETQLAGNSDSGHSPESI
ncbi:MAG: aminopeptidase [Desulfobacterales bacterium]